MRRKPDSEARLCARQGKRYVIEAERSGTQQAPEKALGSNEEQMWGGFRSNSFRTQIWRERILENRGEEILRRRGDVLVVRERGRSGRACGSIWRMAQAAQSEKRPE